MGESEQLSGETLDALSRGMVRLKAELYGRGPEEARAFQNGEFVFCVMKGGLTTVEWTLLEANDEPLVRHVRLRFQEQMRPRFVEVVQQVTERRVLSYRARSCSIPTTSSRCSSSRRHETKCEDPRAASR